jgi:hypothetical protein
MMQASCFYPFSFPYTFWGNAELLLLPLFVSQHFLGQCRAPAFPLFRCSTLFGAMQSSCFYPFSFPYTVWGNAGLLLLPFFVSLHCLGSCRPSAFTLFRFLTLFGVMQAFCFYPFSFPYTFWGHAGLLLLPFFVSLHCLG